MELVKKAAEAMKNSYSPYSKFKVGCAVEMSSGKIFTATNVENASYSATICAERAAIAYAIGQGETEIKKIAVISVSKEPVVPCGVCLQFMSEFAKNPKIYCSSNDLKKIEEFTLSHFLPHAFDKKSLG